MKRWLVTAQRLSSEVGDELLPAKTEWYVMVDDDSPAEALSAALREAESQSVMRPPPGSATWSATL